MNNNSTDPKSDAWPKLDKPALVGKHIRFNIGVSSRLVVEAAQRQFEYSATKDKDSSAKPIENMLEKAIAITVKAHTLVKLIKAVRPTFCIHCAS